MSIEAAIHEIINDNTNPDAVSLLELLPADRIITSRIQSADPLPWCTINLESDQTEYRSSTGSVRQPMVRFQVWHDDHEKGIAIREAVRTLFENKDFALAHGNLLSTRIENDYSIQEDDGVWQFIVDLRILMEG